MWSKRFMILKAALAFGTVLLLTACEAQGTSPVMSLHSSASFQDNAENASGQSVAYQINVEHTGFAPGPLRRPLTELWSIRLPGYSGFFGYPVIANGIVVVANFDKLVALDEVTGKRLWVQGAPVTNGWVGPAYDNGTIFATSREPFGGKRDEVYAFDERTGKKLWSAQTPGQSGISSPPSAAAGVVYTSAAGSDGTVDAYSESTGALQWTAPVAGGDASSPAIASNGIFVSYVCPQTYDFQPGTGTQIWHFDGPCAGGGGSTPVLYDGLLFVGDSQQTSGYNGLVLTAGNGTIAGAYNSSYVPAFAQHLGFFVNGSTLTAQSIPKMKQVWNVSLETTDKYTTPPLIVGNVVYVETCAGNLVGYDVKSGKQKAHIKLVNVCSYANVSPALAYADGELAVPNGRTLIAFKGRTLAR
jgi:outer membrane protein assembly factor BamB